MQFSCIFVHFQVFATVKICYTIKLYLNLAHKITFNMESFELLLNFVFTRTCNMINILANKSSCKNLNK